MFWPKRGQAQRGNPRPDRGCCVLAYCQVQNTSKSPFKICKEVERASISQRPNWPSLLSACFCKHSSKFVQGLQRSRKCLGKSATMVDFGSVAIKLLDLKMFNTLLCRAR